MVAHPPLDPDSEREEGDETEADRRRRSSQDDAESKHHRSGEERICGGYEALEVEAVLEPAIDRIEGMAPPAHEERELQRESNCRTHQQGKPGGEPASR